MRIKASLLGISLLFFALPAEAQTPTVTFVSDTTWAASDPAGTSLGFAQDICLNPTLSCASANLSSIPGARWIWAPGITGTTSPAFPAEFFFSKAFNLPGPPIAGTISVAVDDFAEVFINGTSAGTTGSVTNRSLAGAAQRALATFNITSFLLQGTNVIRIRAANGPFGCGAGRYSCNPAGVVFGASLSFPPNVSIDIKPGSDPDGSSPEIAVMGLPQEEEGVDSESGSVETELTNLDENTPFRVQLTYDEPPDSPPLSVISRWPGGGQRIAVRRTRDPKVFSSKFYVISPESQRDLHGNRLLAGSAEDSAKVASELFAGDWNVAHTGSDTGKARGLARISEDGSNVRLFLQFESDQVPVRCDSVETGATRDSTNGRHTLDVRFQCKYEGEAWGPPSFFTEGRVIYLTDSATSLTFEERGRKKRVSVTFPETPPVRIRVSLMNRLATGLRLSGSWSGERTDGSLRHGGQQTWEAARKPGSYTDFIEEVRSLWPLKVRQWFREWEQAQAVR